MVLVIKLAGGGVLINGTQKNIAFGTPLNNLSVGSSVYMNVGGVRTEFLIVHKGNPDSSIYDSSCDGIWLLMKNVYENKVYGSNSGNYAKSDMNSYLNTTFLSRFDTNTQNIIKQVKIPYYIYDDTGFYTKYLDNGASVKLFLLDSTELHIEYIYGAYGNGGSVLSYFLPAPTDTSSELRQALFNGTTTKANYWTRSPRLNKSDELIYVMWYGDSSSVSNTANIGIRPTCIVPHMTLIDSNMNIIA